MYPIRSYRGYISLRLYPDMFLLFLLIWFFDFIVLLGLSLFLILFSLFIIFLFSLFLQNGVWVGIISPGL